MLDSDANVAANVAGAKEANLEQDHTPNAGIKTRTFKSFQQAFLQELSLPYFGEKDIYSVQKGSKSAGAKELEESAAKEILEKTPFLQRIYHLLTEHDRLMPEQKKVRHISAKMGRSVKQFRDAQKTLQSLQKSIRRLDKRLERILTVPCRIHLDKAVRELMFVEDALANAERTRASYIHPERRRKHDRAAAKTKFQVSKFRSLVPEFDYELDSLRKKAPQQWLLTTLDLNLQRYFKREHKEVTDMTRYRVISAILKSGELEPVLPLTIKQHVAEQTPRKNPSARNSQAS
jgi:hypothetical protein